MSGPSVEASGALILSPEAPYPLAGGGAMRTSALLHYLAERFAADLVVFAQDGAPDPAEALPPGLVREAKTIRLPFHRRSGLARIYRNTSRLLRGRLPLMDRFTEAHSFGRVEDVLRGRRYAAAVVEHFWCAEYLPLLRRCADVVALNLHNVESALHAGCARTEPWPQNLGHRLFERHALRAERELFGGFDVVLAASGADADRVRSISPAVRVETVPNSIPLQPLPRVPEAEAIAFSGNLEYHPNVSAVRFFATQVWRRLRAKRPGLVWRLIGKNPHAVQDIVGSLPGVELTGEVSDAVEELAKCRLTVVPVLAGSGTRVKIVEAWAAGRAVVSSPIGAEGLPIEDGKHIVLAQSPDEWVKQVLKLLEDSDRRRALGAEGRALYERELSWPAAWRRLDRLFDSQLARDPAVAAG